MKMCWLELCSDVADMRRASLVGQGYSAAVGIMDRWGEIHGIQEAAELLNWLELLFFQPSSLCEMVTFPPV